jgi:cell division cycle protein 20 (cofactor of APC complex)
VRAGPPIRTRRIVWIDLPPIRRACPQYVPFCHDRQSLLTGTVRKNGTIATAVTIHQTEYDGAITTKPCTAISHFIAIIDLLPHFLQSLQNCTIIIIIIIILLFTIVNMVQSNKSAAMLKTPPRSMKRNRSLVPSSSPFRTPIKKTPSRHRHRGSSLSKPRISPSPRHTMEKLTRTGSRKSTPGSSYGDRFIPNRRGMNVELCRRLLRSEDEDDGKDEVPPTTGGEKVKTPAEISLGKEYQRRVLSSLCNVPLELLGEDAKPKALFRYGNEGKYAASPGSNSKIGCVVDPYSMDHLRVLQRLEGSQTTGMSASFENTTTAIHRKIPDKWRQQLDTPGMVDDYYLNLISWNKDNVLAVSMGYKVFLWNATTQKTQLLTKFELEGHYGTSVAWCSMSAGATNNSKYLAIGTTWDNVELWDTDALCMVRTFYGHGGRVTSLSWRNQHCLSSGGYDSYIFQHDIRSPNHIVSTFKGHEGEVCGLKWNEEGTTLASGSADDILCIWDAAMTSSQQRAGGCYPPAAFAETRPRLQLEAHEGAVKALDWCPFRRGVLASGGGSSDGCIKVWNSNSGAVLNSVDTFSQVCSVVWSKHQPELCSAHGSSKNELTLWKYGSGSSLTKVKEFAGHTKRVLDLVRSPDGETVVSISADETMRFWDIFGSAPKCRTSDMPMGALTFGMPSIR